MKIKKFNNLWAMGLILFGIILVALYVIKIFFPEYIIGVAQHESVVAFGEYVDSHWWAYYLFTFATSFVVGFFYCCACLQKKNLDKIELSILSIEIVVLFFAQNIIPDYYLEANIMCMLLMPTIMCILNGDKDKTYLVSTVFTFVVNSISQIISLQIRGISTTINYPNSATFTILLIDAYIWLVLLYNYFNYKEGKKNG